MIANTTFLRKQTAPFRALITLFVVTILAFLVVVLSGCAHERVILKAAQTNEVQVLVTNTVPRVTGKEVVSTRLNPVPGGPDIVTTNFVSETNLIERVETRTVTEVTPEVAYTNVSLNPAVSSAVQVGGAVAPVPWAGAAAGIFGTVTSGIFAFINNRRRKEALEKARQASGEATTALSDAEQWAETARILVENVEAVRQQAMKLPGYTADIDKKVVRVLEETQRAAGVKARVQELVEEHTGYTTDTFVENAEPAAPAPAPAPVPIETPRPGDPANRPLSDIIDFAKSGQQPNPAEWSASDIVAILRIRGVV